MSDVARKIKCLARELALRKIVYPKYVRAGRMTRADAEEEIRVLREILEDYIKIKPIPGNGDPQQQSLL